MRSLACLVLLPILALVIGCSGSSSPPLTEAPDARTDGDAAVGADASTAPPVSWMDLEFHVDYPVGTYDDGGLYRGGTEINYLVAHDGALFATASYWNADTAGPNPGPTILVKDRFDGPWRVEAQLGPDYVRAECMVRLRFTTDNEGRPLDPPVELLTIGVTKKALQASVWTRDDTTGAWTEVIIDDDPVRLDGQIKPGVRSLVDHRDAETGIHHVFAGSAAGKLFRGAYDPDAPGRLVFAAEPEIAGPERVHAMTVFEGQLYASLGVDATIDGGGLYRRQDGAQPAWSLAYEWTLPFPGAKPGMRGIRQVPHPSQPGVSVIIGAREDPGIVERIEPHAADAVTVEHDVHGYYQDLWGGAGGAATIIAYNELTEVVHPDTGEVSHLAGLYVNHPDKLTPPHNGSHFLERKLDGTYLHGTVWDEDNPVPAGTQLRGTRTIAVSPFPEDEGRVLYFGGFDAHARGTSHRDTAWIYRAVLPSPGGEPPATFCRGEGTVAQRDVAYHTVDGVDSALLSLDVYRPTLVGSRCRPTPIVVYVHGGGWRRGDKGNKIADKVAHYGSHGALVVSVNYRLSPSTPAEADDPAAVRYPIHNQDVARAIAWVREHAADFGADPDLITLMGHSAGGTIVSSVATDEQFLAAHGVSLAEVRCAVSLDAAGYDLVASAANGASDMYDNAFGTDPAVLAAASPINHVEAGKGIPAFFMVIQGNPFRIAQAEAMLQALQQAGVASELLHTPGYDHNEVNEAVGKPGETIITPVLDQFLMQHCRS